MRRRNTVAASRRQTRPYDLEIASMRRRLCFAATLLLFFTAGRPRAVSTSVVISQVYGGGGNSGATLKNDFIELFNLGTSAVDLTGWSVQRRLPTSR
jgi:hypothetical protein